MTFYKRKVGGIILTWDKLGSGYHIKTDTSVACVSLPVAEISTQLGWAHHIVVSLDASSVQITSKKIIYHRN